MLAQILEQDLLTYSYILLSDRDKVVISSLTSPDSFLYSDIVCFRIKLIEAMTIFESEVFHQDNVQTLDCNAIQTADTATVIVTLPELVGTCMNSAL